MLLAVPLAGIIQIFVLKSGSPQRSEADPEKTQRKRQYTSYYGMKIME
ncbi:MAG: hypothetical protein V8R50_07150 [Clostridia bacterium]